MDQAQEDTALRHTTPDAGEPGCPQLDLSYTATDRTAGISMAQYVAGYRDVPRFMACCRQCGNYGKRWGCPPFGTDPQLTLDRYSQVMLVGTRIVPSHQGLPLDQASRLMAPEVLRLNNRLLQLEQLTGGYALGFVGSCPYCGGAPCSRRRGKPCRHPDKVRPSLEAFGFNISLTASRLLGMELCWSTDGTMPPRLTLVCGLLHNGPQPEW